MNREKGTLSDLIQACRQYEQLELCRHAITARKPGVKAVFPQSEEQTRTIAVVSEPPDPYGYDGAYDDGSVVDVCQTRAQTKRERRRYNNNPYTGVSLLQDPYNVYSFTLEGSPYDVIPYSEYGEDVDTAPMSDEAEDIFDHQVSLIMASVNAVNPNPKFQSGSYYRHRTPVPPRPQFRRNMTCAYCRKPGHIFRYCRQLQRDYPDGQFPPHVAQLIFRELMSGTGRGQFERKTKPPDDGHRGRTPPGVRAIEAPGAASETPPVEDSGNV